MKRTFLFIAILLILLEACGSSKPGPVPVETRRPASTPTPGPTVMPAATLLPSPTVVPTARPNVLYVDPAQDLGPISPYVYGSNISLYAVVPANKLQEAYDSHITALRGPGGGYGETNDLQTYQLDLIISICKKMGATPVMSVRLLDGTPEAAAALVRYANIEQGYNIPYWSIGNEPDIELNDGKNIDTVTFNQQWRAIALAMKAVDPKIKLMGPDISQWGTDISKTPKFPPTKTPTGLNRQDWMTDFLKANGDLVDIVTVHRYPFTAPTDKNPVTVERLRQDTLEWDTMVTYLRDMIHQITGRDIPIAFTEVNSDSSNVVGGVASPDSFYNAIWYADVLGRLIQQNVFMVNYWAIANAGGLGLLSTNAIRPTYYVFQMYNHFGNERIYSSSGVQFVTVYAAKRTDGTLTLMMINLTDSEQRIPLQIQGMSPQQAEVWRFDATHNGEDLGQQAMPADGGVVLSAQSISVYAIGK
jgi:hypothetical protein